MSDSVASLRHKIDSAEELESVVRTMKTVAASSIGQYENAVRSLDDYYRSVQLGLTACFRQRQFSGVTSPALPVKTQTVVAIVFGSDQGLVGQFNEVIAAHVTETMASISESKLVWSVGERIESRLTDLELQPVQHFTLPSSINAITPLIAEILIQIELQRELDANTQIYLFHNQPQSGAIYLPVRQRLLPLDKAWQDELSAQHWPTHFLPQIMGDQEKTLRALIREYLFVTLFRACAESLASENASRLAAMQRAEKNIDELQEDLHRTFHRLRQSDIDEELFDVISGYEALS